MTIVDFALMGIIIWLLAVTVGLIYVFPFFFRLNKSGKEESVKSILARLLSEEQAKRSELKEIFKNLDRIEAEGSTHVQKLGLVRFNPFPETGGDHSFALAILDGNQNGVVITCLHARERTRMYIKPIAKGKSSLTLSEEEKKAIEKAIK